jgi:hypothetical protein
LGQLHNQLNQEQKTIIIDRVKNNVDGKNSFPRPRILTKNGLSGSTISANQKTLDTTYPSMEEIQDLAYRCLKTMNLDYQEEPKVIKQSSERKRK